MGPYAVARLLHAVIAFGATMLLMGTGAAKTLWSIPVLRWIGQMSWHYPGYWELLWMGAATAIGIAIGLMAIGVMAAGLRRAIAGR
jgi:hypothetical protein